MASGLPETTPTNIMLTQVLQICRLLDQPIDLHLRTQFFSLAKVLTCQLLLDTGQDLQCPCILHFLGIDIVIMRRSDGRAMTGSTDDTGHLVGVVAVGVVGVADHD